MPAQVRLGVLARLRPSASIPGRGALPVPAAGYTGTADGGADEVSTPSTTLPSRARFFMKLLVHFFCLKSGSQLSYESYIPSVEWFLVQLHPTLSMQAFYSFCSPKHGNSNGIM